MLVKIIKRWEKKDKVTERLLDVTSRKPKKAPDVHPARESE